MICGGECAAAAFLAASSVNSSVSVMILPMSFAKIVKGDAVGGDEDGVAGWSNSVASCAIGDTRNANSSSSV